MILNFLNANETKINIYTKVLFTNRIWIIIINSLSHWIISELAIISEK